MLTFVELREKTNRAGGKNKDVHKGKGAIVHGSSTKQGVMVVVKKEGPTKFVTYVDGDRLDEYKTKRDAVTAGKQFAQQFKS